MASNQRRIFIITGMSGAGKSQALKIFGDFGFYCVDNLPLALFKNFTDYLKQSGERRDVALGIDVREGDRLREMLSQGYVVDLKPYESKIFTYTV